LPAWRRASADDRSWQQQANQAINGMSNQPQPTTQLTATPCCQISANSNAPPCQKQPMTQTEVASPRFGAMGIKLREIHLRVQQLTKILCVLERNSSEVTGKGEQSGVRGRVMCTSAL